MGFGVVGLEFVGVWGCWVGVCWGLGLLGWSLLGFGVVGLKFVGIWGRLPYKQGKPVLQRPAKGG
jgi:hypothetical protein